ncbi:DNA-binding protein [Coriobacteriales bacterium OH1046]|nr:DNA-binding protein [Coriobacteriales bacterium OH1046]
MTSTMYDSDASTADPHVLPLLLNVRQAAEILNVSEKHVRDLCLDGTIRSVRVGRSWRIGRDSLLEQYGIVGVRRSESSTTKLTEGQVPDDRAEIVIRIELPTELAERLADAKVVVAPAASSVR